MEIVVASTNIHKVEEIGRIMALPGVKWLSLESVAGMPEVIEDGDTFEANAVKKARETALFSGKWALADDSGLEVAALEGAPGVYSARYAGEPVSYERNNCKLMDALQGVSDRRARFVCVAALCSPADDFRTVRGVCEGRISDMPRGNEGFGYDPLFIPQGYDRTFAEMCMQEKNAISHRGTAFRQAAGEWRLWLQEAGLL